MSKADGEMILFKEIFVRPKEEKLEQLKQLMKNENFNELLFDKKSSLQTESPAQQVSEAKAEIMTLPDKSSFFDHQIQVQPPEGLNATIAAPLTPGGGWAPSIPPSTSSLRQLGLKDLTLRAKSGVQAGDVQREAHMSYSLAVLNEEQFRYSEALKFYKRFFFCAKILDDPIGAALALNRLGIVYFNLGKTEKSVKFHLKHAEFSDKENKFAAFYNLGIAYRNLKEAKESIKFLAKALGWANKRMDLESQCITLGQLGLSFQLLAEHKNALHNLENSFNFARNLRNKELQLEIAVAIGALCYEHEDWETSAKYYLTGLGLAKALAKHELINICSCNLGIVEANRRFVQLQNNKKEEISFFNYN
jgi:tetratricopeptide (TPR) repeat protein